MSRGGPLYENGESVVVIFSREQGVQLGLEKRANFTPGTEGGLAEKL